MSKNFECYWSPKSLCTIQLNGNENEIFVIGSNDPSRREYIDMIMDVIRDFNIKPIFAVDLREHNNFKAFCTNICSYIIGSRLLIVDLSAPLKKKECPNCNNEIEYLQHSVNVYWEYGYACGLAKKIIIIIDESQIHELPFDVAGTHIAPYNKKNLKEKVRELLVIKLKEPLLPKGFDLKLPPLPPTPIGPSDHRVPILVKLLKYKLVDYYHEIRPEKKNRIQQLIKILNKFDNTYVDSYIKGGGPFMEALIRDYFNTNIEDFRNRAKKGEIYTKEPRRSTLIIAGDFAFKMQNYIQKHRDVKNYLIGKVHGEFDTEIRGHKFFPQNMSYDYEFLPALDFLRTYGFIRGEPYKSQDSKTEFVIPIQVNLKRLIEFYSVNYFFQNFE